MQAAAAPAVVAVAAACRVPTGVERRRGGTAGTLYGTRSSTARGDDEPATQRVAKPFSSFKYLTY